MNPQKLRPADRIRIELVVRRVDFELDGRVPMARRRQIRDELRSNLLEAAQQSGARVAIKQLGSLHALASSYLELYRGRLDLQAGSWAAIGVYVAVQVLGIGLIIAFHTGVVAGGAHSGTYSFEFWNGLARSRAASRRTGRASRCSSCRPRTCS